jgi:hypothetical protein
MMTSYGASQGASATTPAVDSATRQRAMRRPVQRIPIARARRQNSLRLFGLRGPALTLAYSIDPFDERRSQRQEPGNRRYNGRDVPLQVKPSRFVRFCDGNVCRPA